MLISIDPYYNVDFYNRCLSALKNNNVTYSEYISTTGSYKWYIDVPQKPLMLDFDTCSTSEYRYLTRKVTPLTPDTEYKYYRRADSSGVFSRKYITNDCFNDLIDKQAWLINITNKKSILTLSKLTSSKIWYLGKYRDKRYKLAIVTSEDLVGLIPREQVLYEKKESEKIEFFETEVNYRVLNGKEKLYKFSETPYFANGEMVLPLYYKEQDKQRFLIV